jgi:peptide subunit release factor 1 (eRF1)/intein/homing endonuclease
MDTKQKLELNKFVKKLDKIRGRHTELVTVYVPSGYIIFKIIEHLSQEQHTASNIKDARTRKNVIDSLEKVIRQLRLYKKTPENGLAIFAGNTSTNESKINIEVFTIEPPQPLNMRLYRCDQKFVTDALKEMMEHKEVYGLIVVDRREGNLGLLKGTAIVEVAKFTSNVPGKTTKGGQCLSKDSVIQLSDGRLEKIENLDNSYSVKSVEFDKGSLVDSNITKKWDTKKKSVKIITQHPRLEVESSLDHTFFVRGETGICETVASDLKVGDYLIMPEKIDIVGADQSLNFKDFTSLTEDFAQFLGYFIGDGNFDDNRLNFSEGNEKLANFYKLFFDNLFKKDTKLRFRESKNYYQLRIHYKDLVDFLHEEFIELKKATDSEVPRKILMSKNLIVAKFLKGLFDAEGYIAPEELSIGLNNKLLVKQLQMLFLRFGIIGSFCEYDNRNNEYSNNFRYTFRITDKNSLINFRENIGFSLDSKNDKIDVLIEKRGEKSNLRQLFKNGKEIRNLLEEHNKIKEDFSQVSNFFYNERQMGKETFKKNFIDTIEDGELKDKFNEIMKYNLIPVKIKSIELSDNEIEMCDISVDNQNFIANGLLVHNSQQRYARLRDEAMHEFFKRIGDAVNKEFLDMKDMKALLVGGPGPTKEYFIEGSYMDSRIKSRIKSIQDLSYTGEFGLNELVEKSADTLAKEEIIEEKKLLEGFFSELGKSSKKVVYGEEAVKHAFELAAVDKVIVSEKTPEKLIEEIEELCVKTGAEIKIVSVDTNEGVQLKEIGMVAAFLRYAI